MLSSVEYSLYTKIRDAYHETADKPIDQSTKQFLTWLITNGMLASKPTLDKKIRAIKANNIIRGWAE